MKKKYTFVMACFMFLAIGWSLQAQDYSQLINDYLEQNNSQNFTTADVGDLSITNEVYSKHNKVTHIYATQNVNGIPVFNAIGSFAVKNGAVLYFSNTYQNAVSSRINASTPVVSPVNAANAAASALNLGNANFLIEETVSNQEYILSQGGVSVDQVPVKLVYQPDGETLKLAWDLSIHTTDGNHWWSVRIDALTGVLISQNDWIVSCTFESHDHNTSQKTLSFLEQATANALVGGGEYNVYPAPIESPSHGDRSIIVDPADATASPFGWHDTDGVEGNDFTVTFGNNVLAQEDLNGNNGTGDTAEGGEDLIFDFPVDLTQDATAYTAASITNLFYWNNIIHDIFYQYGFDEEGGNFQETNYTGDGAGSDFVFADAQDGSGVNNATFGTPPDGGNPGMTMFLWLTSGDNSVLTVNSPDELAGDYELTISLFGPLWPSDSPLEGELALARDDDSGDADPLDEFDACDPLTNPEELDGKIAVVRRGSCNFTVKVEAAQAAGAIGVLVVNNVPDAPINLGGDSNTVNIPAGMVTQDAGEALIDALLNDTVIDVSIIGPRRIDGSFDNGIITHEYGHGISNRLTGGPSTTNCLGNLEQMGEGWSDYFGLMLTIEPGDDGADARGIGTFALNEPITGDGIRPTPYSTDMAINPVTYEDVPGFGNGDSPHRTGYAFASALWDMTWNLIDVYGLDEDIYNGTGGNNMALQLVVDGLKLQPCNPGFVDGRNAILAAVDANDEITNKSFVKCQIWDAFARRGIGWSADQGSTNDRTDGIAAFDLPPSNVLNCENLSTEEDTFINFRVYPNPSNGIINIQAARALGEGTVAIYDINGRMVFSKDVTLEGTVRIAPTNLSTGVYVVKIQTTESTQTVKLIMQ